MGNFYVNHVAVNVNQEAVLAELRGRERHGWCSDAIDGKVYIYDEECDSQESNVITELGKSLSSELDCRMLAFLNHDDDILAIWSFETGRLSDTYNSTPNYFGDHGELQGGDAAVIARVAGAVGREAEIEKVLRDSSYAFAFQRHWALAETLKLDPNFCICGATSLAREDVSPTIVESVTKI